MKQYYLERYAANVDLWEYVTKSGFGYVELPNCRVLTWTKEQVDAWDPGHRYEKEEAQRGRD